MVELADRAKISAVTKLETSPQLTQDQNLYDQPPFNPLLSQIAEQRGLPLEGLRGMLTYTATRLLGMNLQGMQPADLRLEYQTAFKYLRAQNKTLPSSDLPKYVAAMTLVIPELEKYPLVKEYIERRTSRGGVYKADGSRNSEKIGLPAAVSYANWARDKLIPSKEPEKFIELEAPEQLGPGQNFFDQPPFDSALQQITQSSGLTLENLRRTFLGVARRKLISSDPSPVMIKDQGLFNAIFAPGNFLHSEKDRKNDYFKAVSALLELLQDFPYVQDYIQSHFDKGLYGFDGSWNVVGRKLGEHFPYSATYAKWVSEKLGRGQTAVLVGIEEIFPQDFGQSRTGLPEHGVSSQRRRWQILKATELIPEKK